MGLKIKMWNKIGIEGSQRTWCKENITVNLQRLLQQEFTEKNEIKSKATITSESSTKTQYKNRI